MNERKQDELQTEGYELTSDWIRLCQSRLCRVRTYEAWLIYSKDYPAGPKDYPLAGPVPARLRPPARIDGPCTLVIKKRLTWVNPLKLETGKITEETGSVDVTLVVYDEPAIAFRSAPDPQRFPLFTVGVYRVGPQEELIVPAEHEMLFVEE